MTGYEQFQMIMAELNYRVKHQNDKKVQTDDYSLEHLKSIFGI